VERPNHQRRQQAALTVERLDDPANTDALARIRGGVSHGETDVTGGLTVWHTECVMRTGTIIIDWRVGLE
jgi:hypothetical protein